MRASPLLSAAAATALLTAVAAPASAATAPAVGQGTAVSAGSLATLSAAGKVLEALRLQLPTGTVDQASALVRVVPLLSDGVPVVDPVEVGAGQEKSFPSRTEGVAGVLSLTSPGGTISALVGPDGPVAQATTTGLGGLSLLGSDVLGQGSFSTSSKVTGAGSTATKALALDGLALPGLADLLGDLGLDLEALPVGTLLDLLEGLDLVSLLQLGQLQDIVDLLDLSTVEDLLGVDGVLETLGTAGVEDLAGELDTAQVDALLDLLGDGGQTAAVEDLMEQIDLLSGALNPTGPLSPASFSAQALPDLGGVVGGVVDTIGGGTGGTTGGLPVELGDGALDPVLDLLDPALIAELEATLADLPGLLQDPTALTAVLQGLLADLQSALVAVLGAQLTEVLGELPLPADLLGLLDVPLLAMGALDISTLARTGDVDAADVTGTLAGLDVLGTDVLATVLGSSTVDLTALLGGAGLGQVQGVVDGLLGSVTDVLAGAGITLPLPEIDVLGVVEETVTDANGTTTARAGVEALSLTWALDELEIPALLSQTGTDIVGGLPVGGLLGGLSASALPTDQLTALLSEPLSLVVGDLTDTAVFTAAAGVPPTVVPGTGAPAGGRTLPTTGAPVALAVLGLTLLGAAAVTRRRRSSVEDALG